MYMHYVEALILCCVAAILYKREMDVASALVYLAAMLAKEVAVPLIILLWLIRRRGVVLHALALCAYAAWRTLMLGTIFGGYGYAVTLREIPMLLVKTPARVVTAWAGAVPWFGALLVIVVLAVTAQKWRWLLLALALSILPVMPVAKAFNTRLAFVPWFAIAILFAFAAKQHRVLLLAAPLIALIVNRQTWSAEYANAIRQSDEARVFFTLGPNDVLAHPLIPPAAIGELQWLKQEWLHRAAGTDWYYDDLFVCEGKTAGKRVFGWHNREVVQVEPRCETARVAPMTIEFHYRGESLFWHFGPYREGTWSIIFGDGIQAFDVPRDDGYRLGAMKALALRVKYTAPEGWSTYSPELVFDFERQPDLVFRR